MMRTRLLVPTFVCIFLATAASAWAATLTGPSTARVLQKVSYRATGLGSGHHYALMARRTIHRSGRAYSCFAFLSGKRRATATETFFGSVPDGLTCVRQGSRSFQRKLDAGIYQVVACVPSSVVPHCWSGAPHPTRTLRVVG